MQTYGQVEKSRFPVKSRGTRGCECGNRHCGAGKRKSEEHSRDVRKNRERRTARKEKENRWVWPDA